MTTHNTDTLLANIRAWQAAYEAYMKKLDAIDYWHPETQVALNALNDLEVQIFETTEVDAEAAISVLMALADEIDRQRAGSIVTQGNVEGDFRAARGILGWQEGDEPAEVSIRRLRDNEQE